MQVDPAAFTEVDRLLTAGQVIEALEALAARLRDAQRYHQLFEVRLMQARHRLGLPLVQPTTIDELPEPQRTQLEDAYIEHCREVGALFLQAGSLREAWMYLRPTGEKELMASGLAALAITPDNLEQVVELALHEGIAPALGYSLVLEHYGTCNAITMFDSIAHALPRPDRDALATLLVGHVHAELARNVRTDIERREGQAPDAEQSIQAMVAARPELFADLNYHIDASHLAATVKAARLLVDRQVVQQALDLAEYGCRLDATYQYPGEEPFAEHYPASRLFFAAQLGEQVDEALACFASAAEQASDNSGPLEVYIALLARLGRYAEAIEGWSALLRAELPRSGFAPSLLELAQASGQFDRVAELYRQRGDVVNYVATKATQKIDS